MSTISGTTNQAIFIQPGPYGSPLTITNTGDVDAATPGYAVENLAPASPTLVNYGRISNSGSGGGVDANMGLIVDNHGIISAAGNGIRLLAAGQITNSGTIIGAVGIAAAATNPATIIDTGTIIGTAGDAIAFSDGDDLLEFQPSSSVFIQGTVDGGGGGNTLEFASAASIGTLTGSGAYFANFSNGTLDAGAQWVFAGSSTIGATTTLADSGTLTVAGTLVNQGSLTDSGYGLQVGHSGYLRNDAGGIIIETLPGTRFSPTVSVQDGTGTVANFGTITQAAGNTGIYLPHGGSVINGSAADTGALIHGLNGVYAYGGHGTVTNYGTITGVSNGVGVLFVAGGVLTNGAAGSTAALISGGYGLLVAGASTITNFGTIAGGYIGADIRSGSTVIDAGTITGGSGTAIRFGSGSNLLVLEQGYHFGGRIIGSATATNTLELLGTSSANAVTADYSALSLTNFGTVAFAPGTANYATLTISSPAHVPGLVTGFTGPHDTIDLTAAGFEDSGNTSTVSFDRTLDRLTINGVEGAITLQLGSGDYNGVSWTARDDGHGGTAVVADSVQTDFTVHNETELNAAFAAIKAGGTQSSANTDYTITFANDISLNTAVSSLTLASGDTLTIDGAGHTLDSGGVAQNFLDFVGPLTIKNLTIANAVASIPTGANWTFSGSGDVIGSGGTVTNSGTATVLGTLADSGALINDGSLGGAGYLTLSGGVLTNQAGGVLTLAGIYGGALGGADTVVNQGSLFTYSLYLKGAGNVTNGAGALIDSQYGVKLRGLGSTVANQGQIRASLDPAGYGIYLRNGGDVVNGGTGNSTAKVEGYYGVTIKSVDTPGATGTVTNDGTIQGTGTHSFGADLFNGGTVANGHSGSAAALIEGGRWGVYAGLDAQVSNYGTILATGGQSGDYGVLLENSGSVGNLGSASLIEGYVGVEIQVDGTVTNAGTIASDQGTSGVAVEFLAGAGKVIVDPGAVFVGYVNGASSLGSTNTLELAVGSGVGTLSGLGIQFTNFGTVNVDHGASWVLTGNNTVGSGQTLTNDGSLKNTGSLLITGALVDHGRLENSGTISDPSASDLIRLGAGATLINDATGIISGGTGEAVYGLAGGSAKVVNSGTILSQRGTIDALYFSGGGDVTNLAGGVITAASTIGIGMLGVGTVVNQGTITGQGGVYLKGGGSLTNGSGGVIVGGVGFRANGSLVNQGTITSSSFGLLMYGTDRIDNSGYIAGTIGIAFVAGGSLTVTNAGTISASGVGIFLQGQGTVIDSGTIVGASGTAVNFYGGSTSNLLVLEHGYHIGGSVVGSASGSNTLELLGSGAGHAVTVDYNGLTLTNFGTVAFAPGASNFATLKITDTTALPGTITGFTGAHDAIDLTQLSDTGNDATYSFNATTHMLTVHGDNGTVQLHLGNGAYGGGFALTNDGHGGTRITAGAAPLVTSVTASGAGISGGSGDLRAGKVVTLTVKLDQSVTVDTSGGTPTLQLSSGGTATYVRGSGSSTLVFSYTVGAGQNTADLTVTGFRLNGGTILNVSGAAANLNGVVTNPAGVLQIDTTRPVVTPVTATALEDSAPTPIGISVSEAGLTVKITGLPDDGTVFLSDRKTRVTVGQTLTVAQLEGLTFQPTLNEHDRSSTLTYTLTDAAGNTSTGTATLKIDVDNGLVYVTPTTLAGKSYDGGGNHRLIVQGSGTADLAGVKGFTEIVLDGALSVSLANGNLTGVTPPNLIVTAATGRTAIDLTGVTAAADRVLVNVRAGDVGSDTITGVGGNDALLISGAGKAGLTKVRGIGNIDLNGAISIALADSNFAGISSGRIAVTAKAGHVTIDDTGVKQAADGVVVFANATDLASDRITGSASGNDVLHVLGSGTAGLAGVSGIGNMVFSGRETLRFADGNFAGVTGGRIFATLGGGGVTLDGSAIAKAGDSLFVSVKASDLSGDVLKGGAGADVLQVTGAGTSLKLGQVSGFDYLTVAAGSSGDTITLGNGNFANTSGLIVITDLGGGNTIDGAAITGNRNLIIHGAAGDTLSGGGSSDFLVAGGGLETLIGGSGDTGFALTSATGKATIQRFSAADDQLVFSDAAFNLGADEGQGGASPQQLAASVFSANANGTFANTQNRFAYNAGTGVLYYSQDGQNADKVAVAVLSGHPTLKSQDLYFFA